MIIDTGSSISTLQQGISRRNIDSPLKHFGVTGGRAENHGAATSYTSVRGTKFRSRVFSMLSPHGSGMDFLERTETQMNFESDKMYMTATSRAPQICVSAYEKRTALTVFSDSTGKHPQPRQHEGSDPNKRPSDDTCSKSCSREQDMARKNYRKHHGGTAVPTGGYRTIGHRKGRDKPKIGVQPTHIPIQGVLPARVLPRVGTNVRQSDPLLPKSARSGSGIRKNHTCVMLANFSDTPLTIPKAAVIGIAEQVAEDLVDRINPPDQPDTEQVTKT